VKYAIIIAALLLTGCNDFTCIEGKVYRRLDGDTWIVSNMWAGHACTIHKESKQ
jgi:hypothetical protein